MFRVAQDTEQVEFDSSIPAIGSEENPQTISTSQYMDLDSPEFIGQSRVNMLGEYIMIFKSNGRYYKINNKL